MTTKLENRLIGLLGKEFIKDKRKFTVKSFKEINTCIVVLTTNGTFNFFPSEAEKFFNSLETPKVKEFKPTNIEPIKKEVETINEVEVNEPETIEKKAETPENTISESVAVATEEKAVAVIKPPVYEKSEIHLKLENSLSEMIDKVMLSKEAIPQATALCGLTNAMINLEKQQITLLKAAGKLK